MTHRDPVPFLNVMAAGLRQHLGVSPEEAIRIAMTLMETPLQAGCAVPNLEDLSRLRRDLEICRLRGNRTTAQFMAGFGLSRSQVHRILKANVLRKVFKAAA